MAPWDLIDCLSVHAYIKSHVDDFDLLLVGGMITGKDSNTLLPPTITAKWAT